MKIENSKLKIPRSGFTLIELLLYVTLAGIMLTATSVFLAEILESRVRNQAINEVEGTARHIIQTITQTLRNAEAVNSPSIGASSSSLSLNVLAAPNDPTIFDLSSGVLRVAEGAGAPVALNGILVTVSSLTFYNLSRSSTPGTVRAEFTLAHRNPENREEYDYSKTFYASGTLRYP